MYTMIQRKAYATGTWNIPTGVIEYFQTPRLSSIWYFVIELRTTEDQQWYFQSQKDRNVCVHVWGWRASLCRFHMPESNSTKVNVLCWSEESSYQNHSARSLVMASFLHLNKPTILSWFYWIRSTMIQSLSPELINSCWPKILAPHIWTMCPSWT